MGNLISQAKAFFSPIDVGGVVDTSNQVKALSAPVSSPAVKKSVAPPQKPITGPYGSKLGEKKIDVSGMVKPLGSFKKGGKVKKTGAYKLHKGEVVVPSKKVSALAKMASRKK